MTSRPIPLFWRLFIPNATVLGVACVVLIVEPANGRVPALVGGLSVMVAVNLVLMRRAVTPLTRLTTLMRRVDPLHPGERVPLFGPDSEVTVLAAAFNDMLDRLEAERRDSGLRALSEREAERRHIAAELHDEIGQTLTAASLQLSRLADAAPPALRDDALTVRDTLVNAIEQVRTLARQLRPEALDALGLVPAMTNLIERLAEQTGLRFERDLARDLPPLGPDGELVVYRVAQEAITNAIRHAEAETIAVQLDTDGGSVTLRVADDGHGLSGDRGNGTGIRTMRERALTVGGRVAVERRPEGGTVVRLDLDVDDLWNAPRVNVLLADDHAVLRAGLKVLLNEEADLLVVAEASDGAEAVSTALSTPIDLAILDVSMPRLTGIQVARQLAEQRPDVRTLILSMHDNEQFFFEALRAGASGYVLKSSAHEDLVPACRAALRGEPFLYPRGVAALVREFLERGPDHLREDPLSPRETEVVKLVAEGITGREIAEVLHISEKTVERHRSNIFEKLGLKDRVALTRYAIRRGLVEP